MINLFLFSFIAYCLFFINLSSLRFLIESGYFNKPFWTRSLRSVFMCPPFAILIVAVIAMGQSLSFVKENIEFVMTKRK